MEISVKKWNRRLRIAVASALLALVLMLVFVYLECGVSNREVRESVVREAASLRELVNARADAIEAKLDGLAAAQLAVDARLSAADERLARMDEKLDALLRLATPSLPDGMQEAR